MSRLITSADVRDYVASIVNAVHPNYVIKVVRASGYDKISLMARYEDECIMRLGRSHKWFSLNNIPESMVNDPLFDNVKNKKKNHWEIPIDSFEDIKQYDKFFVPIAEYLYETYEIEKYPYVADDAGIVSGSGAGISIHLNFGNK